ncbi:hypothetical protein [Phycisphaera mikurensis]|uniref:Uncharacterized protein n=1 Tax=Phycisphaera mikurensis (strain NBRC 102666 / KCTC 22515 / FYK2301M01) TaxID=1142394 RepID=I0IAZ9_PHYMF|nr:hypothetical protein [Phycisphaera mikurensis]MBB6442591.1 hypothetical protein [Phycisphaera mikurensis]BAM02437.1 hypothetical protein PSMK_02780 [Phycisphaera mikurensis NBRC 102666]
MDPFDHRDPQQVLETLGPTAPIVLREAMDAGLHRYRFSRERDPDAAPDYSDATRANMLVDRMYPVMSALVAVADPEGRHLCTHRTANQRALELYSGLFLMAKLKRTKDRLRQADPGEFPELEDDVDVELFDPGMPQNVPTGRVLRQRTPGGFHAYRQLPLGNVPPASIPDDGRDRLCLIAGFDLDLAEDQIERPRLGLYGRREPIWTVPLPELPVDAIAAIHPALADRVGELRRMRGA